MSDVTDMVCEQHPDKPWPHDDCAGPGMPSPVLLAEACAFAWVLNELRLMEESFARWHEGKFTYGVEFAVEEIRYRIEHRGEPEVKHESEGPLLEPDDYEEAGNGD